MEVVTHDIDELLSKSGLKLKIGGKLYNVIDVPFEMFLESAEKPDQSISARDMKTYLAKCLHVEESELDDVGLYGISLSVGKIREWMEERAGLVPSGGTGDDAIPPSTGGEQSQK